MSEGRGRVHDFTPEECQHGLDFPDRLFGHGEIVVTEHRQIGVLALGERSHLVLVEREPRGALGIQTERLEAGNLLAGVGQRAREISPGRHIEQRQPGIERRDVGGIGADTRADSGVDDPAERRSAAG